MKIYQKNVALVLLGLLLTGCPASKDTTPQATNTSTNTDRVVIRGSNTFGEELGPRLISEYKKDHFGVYIDLDSKGTGYGFGNLLAGGCDIAAASRSANTNELTMAKDRQIDMNEYVIGAYNVAVIVNEANPLTDLSKDQVRDIFSGVITNWSQLGGADAAIHLVIRDPISGTYLGFQELAMQGKPYALEPKTETAYTRIDADVAKDPQAIGYSSIEQAARPGIKALSIGGIAPTVESVQKGVYPYMRMLHFYTNKANEPAPARQFIDFVLSASGQKVLDDMGYVPHP